MPRKLKSRGLGDGTYGVRFEEGPHAGKVYHPRKCKIAKTEYQQRIPMKDEDAEGRR